MNADDFIALVVILAAFCGLLGILGWIRERKDPEILPAPDDPRLRNDAGIREWRRKRALIERYQEESHASG